MVFDEIVERTRSDRSILPHRSTNKQQNTLTMSNNNNNNNSNNPTATPVQPPGSSTQIVPHTTGQVAPVPTTVVARPPAPRTDPRAITAPTGSALLGIAPATPGMSTTPDPFTGSAVDARLGAALAAQHQRLTSTLQSLQEIPHSNEDGETELDSSGTPRDAIDEFNYQRSLLDDERARLATLRQEMEEKASALRAQQRELETLQHEVRNYEERERHTTPRARYRGPSLAAIYASPHLQRGEERRQSLLEDHLEAVNAFRQSLGPQSLPPRPHEVATVMINGSLVRVKKEPTNEQALRQRYWDKTKRASLSVEDRTTWHTSATKYVLTKNNKLYIPDVDPTNKKYLQMLRNHGQQLKALEDHMHQHDINDVLAVVVPVDVMAGPELTGVEHDLLVDYPRLTTEHVANSCAWCNRWSQEPYTAENMNTIYECLQKNTDETLWTKSLEEYGRFDLLHKGGPLMFIIILKRQLSDTEAALRSTTDNLKQLKIRDVEGEDVEVVCSEIEYAYNALVHASGPGRNYVPDDLPRDVLKILKTSSVRRFNKMFVDEQESIERDSVRNKHLPIWTPIPELLDMARGHYKLIKSDIEHGGWHVDTKQKKKALKAEGGALPPLVYKCFNCGKESCNIRICKLPIVPSRVEANKKKFEEEKKKRFENRRGSGRGRPRPNSANKASERTTKTGEDGTPLVLNKKQQWVPDQKALSAQKKKDLINAVQGLRSSTQASSPAETTSSTTAPAGASGTTEEASGVDEQLARIQACVDRL